MPAHPAQPPFLAYYGGGPPSQTEHTVYKDYRRNGSERHQVTTLETDEFIRRFLLHDLPRGFHRIRHYGLLASGTRRDNLERARQLLAVAPSTTEVPVETLETRPPCPCCGGHMIVVEILERRFQPRAPPPPFSSAGRQEL